jgi:DNA-binding response OmpR family regulator
METQSRPERAAQTILIVEEDEALRGILDHSLRHAGFAVGLASTRDEALLRLADGPDLVIAEASEPDGFEICRRAKQGAERLPPAVVLIAEPGVENKTRGLEAGADDFVVKPIYVQEVVARARALLQRRERERLELSARGAGEDGRASAGAARFISDLADLPLVDLVRAVASHQKSGLASITAPSGARGEIFFRQGNVVDAEVGRLSGRDAVYRLFCWSAGRLEIEWKSIRRKDTVEMPAQELLIEALARVDEWQRLLTGLPPLDTIFEVDYRVLAERLADIPDEVNRVLRLFDGVRTLAQVIDDSGLPDLHAAAVIGRLCHERIVHDARLPVSDDDIVGTDLEGWLSDAAGPFRAPARAERELFSAAAEAAPPKAPGRSTAPLEPLGEPPAEAVDPETKARFTDRLNAYEDPPEPAPAANSGPVTLQGLGVVRSAAADATAPEAEAAPPEPAEEPAAPSAVPEPVPVAEPVDALPAAGSDEDETPIIEPNRVVRASIEAPSPLGAGVRMDPAALPTVPETRAASGEIMVPAASLKARHSPAAEERLAHLRGETARSFVRPSQSLTPPGSARALDEPPPLLDGPAPEPARSTTELVRATAIERAVEGQRFSSAEAADELGLSNRRRGLFLAGLSAVAVLVVGGALLGLHHGAGSGDEAEAEGAAPPAAAAPPAVVPPNAPAARAELDVQRAAVAARDGMDERAADPKLARLWAAEAPTLLAACRTSYQEARMKDAEAACTAARDANPASADANDVLAHVLLNRDRRPEALAAAERAVRLDGKLADAYLVIAGIRQDAGEMSEAKHAYQRYLELAPHGAKAAEVQVIVDKLGKN